jgi:flavin reductase (DIM6/NTAB) family NADH-FMN oxidoreductase RutF
VAGAVVGAPLIDECYANLECKVVDDSMSRKYDLFILEVVKAWIDPARKHPRTLHHQGGRSFMVAGRTIELPSRKK